MLFAGHPEENADLPDLFNEEHADLADFLFRVADTISYVLFDEIRREFMDESFALAEQRLTVLSRCAAASEYRDATLNELTRALNFLENSFANDLNAQWVDAVVERNNAVNALRRFADRIQEEIQSVTAVAQAAPRT